MTMQDNVNKAPGQQEELKKLLGNWRKSCRFSFQAPYISYYVKKKSQTIEVRRSHHQHISFSLHLKLSIKISATHLYFEMEALRAHKVSGAFLQTRSAALSSLAGCPLPSDLYFNGFAMFIAWWQNQVSYAQGLSLHSMNMQHSLTEKFKHFLSVLMWGMRWACSPRHLADSIFFSWSVSTFCTSVLSKISHYFLIFQYLQHHHQYYLLFISCNNFPPNI